MCIHLGNYLVYGIRWCTYLHAIKIALIVIDWYESIYTQNFKL
jgi:hypothetical protein